MLLCQIYPCFSSAKPSTHLILQISSHIILFFSKSQYILFSLSSQKILPHCAKNLILCEIYAIQAYKKPSRLPGTVFFLTPFISDFNIQQTPHFESPIEYFFDIAKATVYSIQPC